VIYKRLPREIVQVLAGKSHPNLVIGSAPQNARSTLILYEKNDSTHMIFKIFFGCAEMLIVYDD
jgi:hypothetical protein